jgi:hypothetical protein
VVDAADDSQTFSSAAKFVSRAVYAYTAAGSQNQATAMLASLRSLDTRLKSKRFPAR